MNTVLFGNSKLQDFNLENKVQKIDYENFESLFRTKEINFYNIYNLDITPTIYFSSKYYHEHPNDKIDVEQKLRILFIDIELYTYENIKIDLDISKASIPINAVTIIDSETKEITSFYLLIDKNYNLFGISNDSSFDYENFIQQKKQYIYNHLIENKYIEDEYKYELLLFNDEKYLLQSLWNKIHYYDPDILTGWNIDLFDMPYMFTRICGIFKVEDPGFLMSKFGTATLKNKLVNIPEYTIVDLLRLYKPRDEGGLNLGKKQAQYSLDAISKIVLKMGKVEYKKKNIDLYELYIEDPDMFLIYNIVDTILCLKLNNTLKHIELYNDIRRIMKTPMTLSMVGSSALFDTFVYYKLLTEKKYVRMWINNEIVITIDNTTFNNQHILKDSKGLIISPPKINTEIFNKIWKSFHGAYVKDPKPRLINDGSLIIDLDATSLYPSMILQSNISFDSYFGRVIPPCTYKSLALLEDHIGIKPLPNQVFQNIQKIVWDYINTDSVKDKKEKLQFIYYILVFLFKTLQDSNIELSRIYKPSNTNESLLLKNYLIPLLDILNLIHPDNPNHNKFMYDYFFLPENEVIQKYNFIYILHNAGKANSYIIKHPIKEGIELIKNFSLTLAGTMFYKHEEHLGLFSNFLIEMGNMRRDYKNKRNNYEYDTKEYNLYENRQKAVKVIMNTLYGLYGLSTFRYSNHWLAQSITNNGEMINKLAQFISEEYLKFKFQIV